MEPHELLICTEYNFTPSGGLYEPRFQKINAQQTAEFERIAAGLAPRSFPFPILRVVGSEGSDEFAGFLMITRWKFDDVRDDDERTRLANENIARDGDNPETIWTVGYLMEPRFRRRGVASAAVKTAVAWLQEKIGTQRITAVCPVENEASAGLLRKCGFTFVKEYQSAVGRENFGGMFLWQIVRSE
ncbi:hypothetical protein HK100_004773 [Physocladia obscura]|uniref:N-acetyltransferase domain-containing protein n=1 Tax=Physocladia obscura TaxID=109957 RepID=A0AAD5SV85_9FUNG|nr:hypothetical protein HK100_004773 [Physocladia obscura]